MVRKLVHLCEKKIKNFAKSLLKSVMEKLILYACLFVLEYSQIHSKILT